MAFDPQPVLSGRLVELRPLRSADYDDLYAVAAVAADVGSRPHGGGQDVYVYRVAASTLVTTGAASKRVGG